MRQAILTILFTAMICAGSWAQSIIPDTVSTQTAESTTVTSHKSRKKGDRIVQAQILRLKNQNKETKWMIVFAEAEYQSSISRTKMRLDYILKRERIYLGNIFFADVAIVESVKEVTDMNLCLKTFVSQYPGLQLWSVLNADGIMQRPR